MSNKQLEQILDFSNYRKTLTNQLNLLRDSTVAELTVYYNGGIFSVTRELLTFIYMLDGRKNKEVVVLDDNNLPVKVQVTDFLEELLDVYFRVTNQYIENVEKLRKQRDVKSILDLDHE
jgi:hypothetical protein